MEFDLPVSRLWDEPREDWDDGAWIEQTAPDGRRLRVVYLGRYEPGVPWDHDTPAPRDLRKLAELRIGAIRNFHMSKIARKTGPEAGSFNRRLPKGLLATFEGIDEHGRALVSRHALSEDGKRGPGYFEASTYVFGERVPDDPLFDAVVASVR